MKMKEKWLKLSIGFVMAIPTVTFANIYDDNLTRCVVESTTAKENQTLVQWMYMALSASPDIHQFSKLSTMDEKQINQNVALLFQSLLKDRCHKELELVTKYSDESGLDQAFRTLGQTAMLGIMKQPEVTNKIGEFLQYMKTDK